MTGEPTAATRWPLDTRPIRALLLLSLLDAVLLFPQTASRNGSVRLVALGLAVSQGLAIGLGLGLISSLGNGRTARWIQGGIGLILGVLVLGPDVAQRAAKLPWLGSTVWSGLLVLGLLLPVLAGGALTALARNTISRPAGLWLLGGAAAVLALVLQQLNHRILIGNYPGIHLLVLVLSGLLLTCSQPPRTGSPWLVAVGFCGLMALLVPPPR